VIRASKHARLPVYDGNLDEIIGFISAKQYLLVPEATLDELLNPVLIVPEQKRVSDLFHQIQRQAISLVVVVDEYGHTAGIITKEDLVEEIVGEIHDEYDVEQEPIIQLGPGRLLVGGLVAVGDLAEELGVRIETEAVTLNGLLAEVLGRIPVAGEVIERGRLMFQVGEVRRHRVVRCIVRLLDVTDMGEGGGHGAAGPDDPGGAAGRPGGGTVGPGPADGGAGHGDWPRGGSAANGGGDRGMTGGEL
jgi:putative hemolysin